MSKLCALLLGMGVVACRPELAEPAGLVDSIRVLAIQSEPAEARPGESVTFRAFLSGSDERAAALSWSFCTAPKPVTENNSVSSACLSDAALVAAGRGLSISVATPADGCARFGPDVSSSETRPRDPDATGGYFQPLRVDLRGAEPVFQLQRLRCSLAEASADLATEFAQAYRDNQNPHLLPVLARVAAQSIPLSEVPRGAQVELEASWAEGDQEAYAYYDRTKQAIVTRHEALRVAWYVDAGQLESAVTGRAEDDSAIGSVNSWLAPNMPGQYQLWVVLRDSRGGVDFARARLTVLP